MLTCGATVFPSGRYLNAVPLVCVHPATHFPAMHRSPLGFEWARDERTAEERGFKPDAANDYVTLPKEMP